MFRRTCIGHESWAGYGIPIEYLCDIAEKHKKGPPPPPPPRKRSVQHKANRYEQKHINKQKEN